MKYRRRRLDRSVVAGRAPQAVLCADPLRVVSWATDALDEVRRETWRQARAAGHTRQRAMASRTIKLSHGGARELKNSRYALWKNPEDLTTSRRAKLAWIAKAHPYLYRAWLLKEGLRTSTPFTPPLITVLSNGLIESVNTKIRATARIAFGLGNHAALIALPCSHSAACGPHSPEDDLFPARGSGRRSLLGLDGAGQVRVTPDDHRCVAVQIITSGPRGATPSDCGGALGRALLARRIDRFTSAGQRRPAAA